jgi:hypothetical protein
VRPILTAALLSTLAGPLLAPAAAWAGKPGAKHKPAAAAKKAPPAAAAKERAPSAASSESKSSSASSSSNDGDDSSSESTTPSAPAAGGKKVTSKTYTFGAMDVEGKLKTPQLLYFLNRVKLELDMSAPDKRSFMKELQQSADDKNL